jgi:hypothetical protein
MHDSRPTIWPLLLASLFILLNLACCRSLEVWIFGHTEEFFWAEIAMVFTAIAIHIVIHENLKHARRSVRIVKAKLRRLGFAVRDLLTRLPASLRVVWHWLISILF